MSRPTVRTKWSRKLCLIANCIVVYDKLVVTLCKVSSTKCFVAVEGREIFRKTESRSDAPDSGDEGYFVSQKDAKV
jgi:hypothetical protein